MRAQEADNLKIGDDVVTYNGKYAQFGRVTKVEKDHRGVRWIYYSWDNPSSCPKSGCKTHKSVYLPIISEV